MEPLEALRWKKDSIPDPKRSVWESRKAFVLAPWEARIPCIIDQDAEGARASHDKIETESLFQRALSGCSPTVLQDHTTLFFTDGRYEGMVGASAGAPREGVFERRHLGTTDDSTVYVAELSGIEMALAKFVERARDPPKSSAKMVIFSDSQAAIQAVQNPKRSSSHFVLQEIYDHVRALRSQTLTFDQIPVEIRWIPAHVGVPGNETADA